jgi:hypothetical protein
MGSSAKTLEKLDRADGIIPDDSLSMLQPRASPHDFSAAILQKNQRDSRRLSEPSESQTAFI